MARIIYNTAVQMPIGIVCADHADGRVDRSRRFDNVWVALSRMCPRLAVLHAEAPVESHGIFMPYTETAPRRLPQTVCDGHRPDDLGFDMFEIARIRHGALLISELLDHRRCVIVLPG